MNAVERISRTRRNILVSKLKKEDGCDRNAPEIIESLSSRCAIFETLVGDRAITGEFSERANEQMIGE
ncbi:hypothetical protein EHQ12_05760 [Leptospira gomenensis]|uniref:Uncharacterized protein n=2 Tax=Leptospira gomenensis TaxID=2484974 RepID=A0A5F1YEQ4_9LEPT|nr:hypothetical protein [Leptospira gomenensis]TGK36048.1 hypothetical protein EHQ17_05590 [Leptospira gomenensis]TGK41793.1 hypothetical protein EHQ12_05760 [Leptospira gomenensis]TGK53349.1 hypothetical protein EHQ07_00140 [Leptospira gomenensis]TGK64955.1 hypothetical protein EHQ13_06385 [Leptospira gomenensis]